MPGESPQHAALVKDLISHIRALHEPLGGFVLYSDTGSRHEGLPERISGYIPDVFASDVPATFRIIGEAKTHRDMNTLRSQRQVKAFLDFLSLYPNSVFYLAIPVFSHPDANRFLNEVSANGHERVEIKILPLHSGADLC